MSSDSSKDAPRESSRTVSLAQCGVSEARLQALREARAEDATLELGRVLSIHYGGLFVAMEEGTVRAEPSGTFRRALKKKDAAHVTAPAVGDWLALRPGPPAQVERVLPRDSFLARKAAGEREQEQILCANVHTALIVGAVDDEAFVRRVDRYLAIARVGNVEPLIVLSKCDMEGEKPALALLHGTPTPEGSNAAKVLAVSARTGEGLGALRAELLPGRTYALLGSSGAGKSTLLNALADSELSKTQEVRASDGRGRHTTTHRELFALPHGALIIDTPGMREVGLTSDLERDTFPDVEALAEGCRFGNCTHRTEPGCAVRAAVDSGNLALSRVESFQKLKTEAKKARYRLR
ncbi:MAG: ribosome small subunit-dependent GTPase A [Polyangiaceae bacterium]